MLRCSTVPDSYMALSCAGDGPAVVLLHGIGGNRGQWGAQLSALAPSCALVAWDARGYGDSSGPPVRHIHDFADDLLWLLDTLGLERVIAVGHSMGGRILMEFCAQHSDRIGAMVLSGAQASFLAHMDAAGQDAYIQKRRSLFDGDRVSLQKARAVAAQVLPAGASSAATDRLARDFQQLRPDGYLAALNASVGWDRSDLLPTLDMPVTVLGGALDTVCPPSECARIARLIGQGPAQILDGIGHMPQIEAPQIVTDYLRAFITEHGHLADALDTRLLQKEPQ